jgi:acetyl esterase
MPLDPLIQRLLAASAAEPPVDALTLTEARARMRERAARLPACRAHIGAVRDLILQAGPRPIPARLYSPPAKAPPLIAFFHGGGWAIGDLDTHDNMCRRLCADAGAAVLSIEYRLAPEHPFPAAYDDCREAVLWAVREGAALGAEGERLVLAGDSAGANLAAAVALALRDEGEPRARAQVLFYPALQFPIQPTPSYDAFGHGFGLTRRSMEYFWRLYAPASQCPLPSYAAPLNAERLSDLPPAFIVTAEYDVLRDEGEFFAERLNEARVAVELRRVAGVNHGFMALEAMLPAADAQFREVGAWIKARCR